MSPGCTITTWGEHWLDEPTVMRISLSRIFLARGRRETNSSLEKEIGYVHLLHNGLAGLDHAHIFNLCSHFVHRCLIFSLAKVEFLFVFSNQWPVFPYVLGQNVSLNRELAKPKYRYIEMPYVDKKKNWSAWKITLNRESSLNWDWLSRESTCPLGSSSF